MSFIDSLKGLFAGKSKSNTDKCCTEDHGAKTEGCCDKNKGECCEGEKSETCCKEDECKCEAK